MASQNDVVRINGLRELERAFKLVGRGMEKSIREALEAAAEPVRSQAQALALVEIPRISVPGTTVPWHMMRTGVTRRTAYVAPVQRGRNTKKLPARWARPNLKTKILEEALEPALAANTANVEKQMGLEMDELFRAWSRV